uniref:Uncharacterized protein n=1 Tax=Ditylenchus dipsaci TaxID=166011 RepID=A0A915D331_9BILA
MSSINEAGSWVQPGSNVPFTKYPVRVIYAVLVDKPVDQGENLITNPTTIIYSKSSLLRREFKSLEDLLILQQKQNAGFLHISIYKKNIDEEEIKKIHFSLVSQCPIDIPHLLSSRRMTLFESFEHQNRHCQYEIVVSNLEDINVSACNINKLAKNYVTNEIMESILLKDSQDDSLKKKYNDADWCFEEGFPVTVTFLLSLTKLRHKRN